MVFSDLLFIFVFLPLFIISYIAGYYIDKQRIRHAGSFESLKRPMLWRNCSLMVFSIFFYSWGEPVYIFLMLFTVLVNYIFGILINHNSSFIKLKKLWLFLGVTADLVILGSFKYLGFFSDTLNLIGIKADYPHPPLPIGISFYIFQSLSYLVDIYRNDSKVQKNYFDLLLYIAMFPQLIAGPIVRYGSVADEINYRTLNIEDISEGSYRFFIGLGKKVIFANILGEIASQLIGGSLSGISVIEAWVGIIAFTLQIYFDFSGYSDMAIGLGRSVGFHFPENFNHPYVSRSMTEFWRRWHMSLGSFFRDYVYIPMGGNRKHQALNILTVWFLTGMWHGASWNFIVWGLYYGLIISIEKFTLLKWKLPILLSHIYSIFLIVAGWGIFYFDDMSKLAQFYKAFFGFNAYQGFPANVESLIFDNLWIWLAAIVFCLPIRPWIKNKIKKVNTISSSGYSLSLLLSRAFISISILIVSVALLIGATNNAFIYTRF